MYVCMYVCMYVYIYIYIYICPASLAFACDFTSPSTPQRPLEGLS